MNDAKKSLAQKLAAGVAPLKALIGFDGFVDEIVHVVDKRIDPENFSRIDTILFIRSASKTAVAFRPMLRSFLSRKNWVGMVPFLPTL